MNWNPAKLSLAVACALILAAAPAFAEGTSGSSNDWSNNESRDVGLQGQRFGDTDYSNRNAWNNRGPSGEHKDWSNNERGIDAQRLRHPSVSHGPTR